MMFYALVTLCISGSALAHRFEWGPCPEIATMPNFSLSKLEGRWYEIRRYFMLSEFSAKCVSTDFKSAGNGTMTVNSTAISGLTGHEYSSQAMAIRSPYPSDPGMLKIKVPGLSFGMPTYHVLGTDYTSHLVGYVCINLELLHFKLVWIGSREKDPAKAIMNKASKIMKKHKLNEKWLMKTDQKDCEVETYESEVTQPPSTQPPSTQPPPTDSPTQE